MTVAAIALFCDDIREERNGGITLVGVMTDNLGVPAFGGALSKLGIYVRIHLPSEFGPQPIDIVAVLPDGSERQLTNFSAEMIEKTRVEAVKAGNPVVGLFSSIIAAPFPVPGPGRVLIELRMGSTKQTIGALNFVLQSEG